MVMSGFRLHFMGLLPKVLTAVSGVGLSPTLATCETSQLLLAGVSGVFISWFFRPFSAKLLIGPSHMSLNNLERDVKP